MFYANNISTRGYERHVRLKCLEADSKITLTPNAFERSKSINIHKNIFSLKWAEKKNIQSKPERRYSLKKECI